MTNPAKPHRGPFHPANIRPKDRYELSNGHAIYCTPVGGQGSVATTFGGTLIDTDPSVQSTGTDTGFTDNSGTLRAPDLAVGVPNTPGWVQGTPPLAIEYAGVGQDEPSLQEKIKDLLTLGTQLVWVVRLVGPRRVEVYEPGQPMRVMTGQDELTAPGVLSKPIPVEMFFDRDLAHHRALENLLNRFGYSSVEAIHEQGRDVCRKTKGVGRSRARAHGWSWVACADQAGGFGRIREVFEGRFVVLGREEAEGDGA